MNPGSRDTQWLQEILSLGFTLLDLMKPPAEEPEIEERLCLAWTIFFV